jgi:aminoglycoside phosphotransferase (APT) family kinase protein
VNATIRIPSGLRLASRCGLTEDVAVADPQQPGVYRQPAPAVVGWALRTTGCTGVVGCVVRPLRRGAVAERVEEIELHLTGCRPGGGRTVRVVEKSASRHEVAGLRAAQSVRPAATAVPELVAAGRNTAGWWLVTPFVAGAPLSGPRPAAPANLFESLARLHAAFRGGSRLPDVVPRVDVSWWRQLCRDWVLPRVEQHRGRHGTGAVGRAVDLVNRAAEHPAVARALGEQTPTLLHGDVHAGNVIVDGDHAWLIDWGSCRVGPAMLDLANLVALDSDGVAVYRDTWARLTGTPLDAGEAARGYRWAGVQLPIQYLPWTVEHRTTAEVHTALDQAEQALAIL